MKIIIVILVVFLAISITYWVLTYLSRGRIIDHFVDIVAKQDKELVEMKKTLKRTEAQLAKLTEQHELDLNVIQAIEKLATQVDKEAKLARGDKVALTESLIPYATAYGESMALANRSTVQAMEMAQSRFGELPDIVAEVMMAYGEARTELSPPIYGDMKNPLSLNMD
jgi:cell division protein FtsB